MKSPKIDPVSTFKSLAGETRRRFKKKGISREDVARAIEDVRKERKAKH